MIDIPFYWVDSFTSKPFGGGATIVCILDEALDDNTLSKIAQETGVLESAFVMKTGENEYQLRWFAARGEEVYSAGYATLATSHILAREYGVKSPIKYKTISGEWIAEVNNEKISIFLPFILELKKIDVPKIAELFGFNDYVEMLFNEKYGAYCVVVENQKQVSDLVVDQCKIVELLNQVGGNAVVITSVGDEGFDFAYRLFLRDREDYACGTAQTALSHYWSERLGKSRLLSIQPHTRVSVLESEPLVNGVRITSEARVIVKGTMQI